MDNIILMTDSYKVTHHKQYPPKTETVYSYFESRGGKFDRICFFGLQYILKKYLVGKVVTMEKIEEAQQIFNDHFDFDPEKDNNFFNKKGWIHILEKHDGRLPVRIKAVEEGTVLPTKNVCFTIENTDPACYWLTNYLETLLVQVWYPSTVATNSREHRKVLLEYLEETGDPSLVDFKLHDFGFRGVSSVESAGIGAAAHLTQFLGTDTLAGIAVAKKFYGAGSCGFSIPASEHSTITSWGRDKEADAFANMLEQFPTGLVACVSDSFDIFKACDSLWGNRLRDKVLGRNGTLVIRPDSGDPVEVDLKVLEILGNKFGFVINGKGYKVLNDRVRVIQGDGIDYEMMNRILENLKIKGWSADNISFGSGGALLQRLHRDTQQFAMKCSMIKIGGVERDVYKEPVTQKNKNSKRGRLELVKGGNGEFITRQVKNGNKKDLMKTVFENGNLIIDQKWQDILAKSKM